MSRLLERVLSHKKTVLCNLHVICQQAQKMVSFDCGSAAIISKVLLSYSPFKLCVTQTATNFYSGLHY